MVRKQLVKTSLIKRKLNKYSIEILRNIEILCFIKKNSIKKLQEIILDKIGTNVKLKTFASYLKNYLFKFDYNTYNYEEYRLIHILGYRTNEWVKAKKYKKTLVFLIKIG